MFMTSVGLAVAAIPEGLPAVVTIMLSIGVTKMAKKNAIIRKLPAVETLGCSKVICSDKTGTLTKNKMELKEVRCFGNENDKRFVLELATMCSNSNIEIENESFIATGEPTESAIVTYAFKAGIKKDELYSRMRRVNEIPFDSTRKLMTTVHKYGNKYRIITKGAPDVLLKICNRVYEVGSIKNISDTERNAIGKENISMAEKAYRVLGVAYMDVDYLPNNMDSKQIERNLIFVGLVGMIDEPREGVKEAVANCKRAGIKTVMITGDHIVTATAIAKELGIYTKGDIAITGKQLDEISKEEFERDIMKYSVFARVSPEHKVRIVEAFKANNIVVAMTGDGVNDAPALKSADIGIAMGGGTDVAKNASDMILSDDNFVTIVESVKEGRHIYENIKKAIHFLIATNVGEIVVIFLGLLIGIESPLLAIQLLWINLVTDSFPAIALGLEKEDKNIMNRKPIDNKKGIFSDGMMGKILVEGSMIGVLTLLAFFIGNRFYGLEVGRTMAFVSLGLLELIHSFNIKSDESILNKTLFDNKYLLLAFATAGFLQIIVVLIPGIANLFGVVGLNLVQWGYVLGISILPVVIIEFQKKSNEIKFGKIVYAESK